MACQKNPYPTQDLALRALEAIHAKGKPGKKPVRTYPCEVCDSWHLTSKKLTGKKPRWERASQIALVAPQCIPIGGGQEIDVVLDHTRDRIDPAEMVPGGL